MSEGMTRIGPVTQDLAGEVCPFCTQDIGGHDLIAHYRAYFSQAYEDLKIGLREVGEAVRNTHGGDIPSAFERDVRTAVQAREFWKDFAKLPGIDIDTAAIARQWNAARESVLDQIRAKAAAPLEPMAIAPETRRAIQDYRVCIAEVAALSERLVGSNDRLDIVKEQAAADDLAALGDDLAKLKAQKARFDPAVARHCAAYLGDYAAGEDSGIGGTGPILNLLLQSGGRCCMRDNQGDTPLHYAVAEGIKELADYADIRGRIRNLLGHGADPDESNKRGYTPLHFSAKTDSLEHGTNIINALLQAGADLNRAAKDGNTPLHLAAGAAIRLDSGHGHDIFSESLLNDSDIAHFGDEAFIVKALLSRRANPNTANAGGMTPLLVVLTLPIGTVSPGVFLSPVEALLSAGADPDATTPAGITPLHLVLDFPETLSLSVDNLTEHAVPLVKSLLGAGADPDRKNLQGDTPLHVAVREEWGEDMVKALLAGRASPCIQNSKEQFVPEQLARGSGQECSNSRAATFEIARRPGKWN